MSVVSRPLSVASKNRSETFVLNIWKFEIRICSRYCHFLGILSRADYQMYFFIEDIPFGA
jgi:hypothetical protein